MGRLLVFQEGQSAGSGISKLKNDLLGSKDIKKQGLGLLLDAFVPFSGVPGRIWSIALPSRRMTGVASPPTGRASWRAGSGCRARGRSRGSEKGGSAGSA